MPLQCFLAFLFLVQAFLELRDLSVGLAQLALRVQLGLRDGREGGREGGSEGGREGGREEVRREGTYHCVCPFLNL